MQQVVGGRGVRPLDLAVAEVEERRLLRRVGVPRPELRDAELEARQGDVRLLLDQRREAVDRRLRAGRVVAQRQPRRRHARVVRGDRGGALEGGHGLVAPLELQVDGDEGELHVEIVRPRPGQVLDGRPARLAGQRRRLGQRQHQERRAAGQRIRARARGGRLAGRLVGRRHGRDGDGGQRAHEGGDHQDGQPPAGRAPECRTDRMLHGARGYQREPCAPSGTAPAGE